MQIANVMLALGGDIGNTVPKYGVTAAEIAVLQAIHGNDAVTEIEIVGEQKRANSVERARLVEVYGRASDNNNKSIVKEMFPGVAARVFESCDELQLAPEQYKPETKERRSAMLRKEEAAAAERAEAIVEGDDADNGDEVDELPADDEPMAPEAEVEPVVEPAKTKVKKALFK